MEIWLDTIDVKTIDKAKKRGLLDGITTNPSILADAGQPVEEILDNLFTHFPTGPIAVQTTAHSADEIVEQGKDLFDEYATRIIVKIPVTEEGLEAIHRLADAEIPVMATAIYDPMQALLAARAGASYVVPYFSHLGEQALDICKTIQAMYLPAQLLIASLKTAEQVIHCAAADFDAVTVKGSLFDSCLATNPKTKEQVHRFDADWQRCPASKLLT